MTGDQTTAGAVAAPRRWLPDYGLRDLAGGVAAALVVLPQAMAYGVALFAFMDMSAASGALAGLVGAACLGLVSGLFGGTVGLISSPTGPALALLSGSLVALAAHGLNGGQLLAGLVALIVLAGLMQIAIAVSGGGKLIKFIPYPVVVGFMTGAALLMIRSQFGPIFGDMPNAAWEGWQWIPGASALATLGLAIASARWLPKIPPVITGLIGGTLIFHALAGLGPGPVPEVWVVGALPGFGDGNLDLSVSLFRDLPLWPVVSGALALAMLASLNTLLSSVIADLVTGARHDARRELIAQGLGQMLAGLAGGMGGSATTGATLVAVKTGARRWAGITAGAAFVLMVFFFAPAGKLLPISVLAGIIVHVAVGMIERDMFEWLRAGRTRSDAMVALLVTIVTVAYDLVTAVGAGIVITIILFIRSQAQVPVVHSRSTCAQRRSVRLRTEEEHELLEQHGERIVLYELRGNLFFATADRLFEELLPDLDRPAWVIFHMRRAGQIDLTGIKILHQIAARLQAHGGQLLFCEVHRELDLGEDINRTLAAVGQKDGNGLNVRTFVGSDEALEYAEDALLTELDCPPAAAHEHVALADSDLCQGMTPPQIAALEAVLHAARSEAGQQLFAAGDSGDDLYIVMHGEVEVRLQTTRHHYKRLAKCGPGTFFGEVAFLDPGPRTADAYVMKPTELMVFDRDSLRQLEERHPDVAVALLIALGRAQGQHLRHTDEEIQRMAQW